MATLRECEEALRVLAGRLSEVDPDLLERHAVNRTLSVHVIDLNTDFSGRIDDGVFVGLVGRADPAAQIGIALTSDDLLALTQGQLNIAGAWATGRVKIDASVLDLLKLRALL